jgi:hypothetical protein
LSELEQREKDGDDGLDIAQISLGLVFVFGAVVFGFLAPPGTLVVSFGLMIPAVALIGNAVQDYRRKHRVLAPPANRERELLSAIRQNGGRITAAEAAMETSLTVREADRMLTELASGGHLSVESESGTLFYGLPGRRAPELN